ncbi:MAG: DUF6263 family protein [Planctomycetota bacterium]
MKSVATTALAVFVAAGALTAQETQTAGMAWSLSAGDQFSTKVEVGIEIVIELPGMPMGSQTQSFDVTYQLDHKVTEVADGKAKVDATVGPVKLVATVPMLGELSYDSAEDDAQNPLRMVRHLVGKQFNYTMRKDGEVTEVSGGDALVEEVTQAAASEKQDQGGGFGMVDPSMLAGIALALFQDGTLRTTLAVHSHVLPQDGVAAATYSLHREEEIATVGSIKFTTECQASEGEDGTSITFSAEEVDFKRVEVPVSDNPMAAMQAKLLQNLQLTDTEVRGEATFDKALGRVIRSTSVRRLKQEGPLPEELKQMMQMQGAQVQDDMQITQDSKLTVKISEIAEDDRRRF